MSRPAAQYWSCVSERSPRGCSWLHYVPAWLESWCSSRRLTLSVHILSQQSLIILTDFSLEGQVIMISSSGNHDGKRLIQLLRIVASKNTCSYLCKYICSSFSNLDWFLAHVYNRYTVHFNWMHYDLMEPAPAFSNDRYRMSIASGFWTDRINFSVDIGPPLRAVHMSK